jgi:hypothetical protein
VYEIFDHPAGMNSSTDVQVAVNGEDVFVYDTRVNHNHYWSWTTPTTTNPVAIFDFDTHVDVTLTYPYSITEAVVRPLAEAVDVTISGNTVSFTLDTPQSYVVEVNGTTDTALHLFTNYIDHDAPDPNNLPSNMIYYGPGVHNIGTVQLPSNKHVYIAGGAVLSGQFKGYNVSNVTIEGRGIITGKNYVRDEQNWFIPFEFIQSDHLTLDGVTFLDPAGWVIHSNFNTDVTINRINMISARQNGDGVSLQSNHNVTVTNVFARTWDDSLVVKNYSNGTTSNILFDNITIWTDLAQSMEVGFETYGATMDNITFQNITVLHNFHKPVVSIHNGDQAVITNVIFRNIIVEDAQIIGDNPNASYDNELIDFTIENNSIWSTSNTRGQIDGVLIENMTVLDGRDDLVIRIEGYDANHTIQNVVIRNLNYKGVPITSDTSMPTYINSYTSNIVFESGAVEPPSFQIDNQTIEAGISNVDWSTFAYNITSFYGNDVNISEAEDFVDYNTPGIYTVTLTGYELFGGETTETLQVTVEDTTPPSFNDIPTQRISTVVNDIDWTYLIEGLTDNSDTTISVSETDPVNYGVDGTYIVTVIATDASGNERSKPITVIVEDISYPSFDPIADQTLEIGSNDQDWTHLITNITGASGRTFTMQEVQDTVDYHGLGTYHVTVSVTDSDGRQTVAHFDVTIVDTTPPEVVLLPGIDTVSLEDTYIDAGVSITDLTSFSVDIENTIDTTVAGRYSVTYTVTDEGGNETSITRYVRVVDHPQNVTFVLGPAKTTIAINEDYEDGSCEAMIGDQRVSCDIASNTLDSSQEGVYQITYEVEYNGHAYQYTRYVFVIGETPDLVAILPKKEGWL